MNRLNFLIRLFHHKKTFSRQDSGHDNPFQQAIRPLRRAITIIGWVGKNHIIGSPSLLRSLEKSKHIAPFGLPAIHGQLISARPAKRFDILLQDPESTGIALDPANIGRPPTPRLQANRTRSGE